VERVSARGRTGSGKIGEWAGAPSEEGRRTERERIHAGRERRGQADRSGGKVIGAGRPWWQGSVRAKDLPRRMW